MCNITDISPKTIPNSVIHLTFGDEYNQSTIIPNSVIDLIFGYNQPSTIENEILPKNNDIKILVDNKKSNKKILIQIKLQKKQQMNYIMNYWIVLVKIIEKNQMYKI